MSYRTPPRHPSQTICKIDGVICSTERQLYFYLKKLPISHKEYYDTFLKVDGEGVCKGCNANTQYRNLRYGYANFCSHQCSITDPDIAAKRNINSKRSLLDKYGVTNPSQMTGWRDKVKTTNLRKYGVENYVNPKKARQTQLEKYGTHYVNTPEYKESVRKTSWKKYGVEHFTQSDNIKKKSEATTLERYGVKHVLSLIGKSRTAVTHKMIRLHKHIQQYADVNNLYVNLPPEDVFLQNSKDRIFETTCLVCNTSFFANWRTISNKVICKQCYKPHYVSNWEREVSDYIRTLTESVVINNHRQYDGSQLHELDIYLPELKLGFECNGVYWHGEVNGKKEKYYHLNKTSYYEQQGVRVIQIWDREWYTKQSIVKSRIQNLLHKTVNRLFARKLTARIITSKEARAFFDATHLGGFLSAKYHIGLVTDQDDIVSAMSVTNKGRLGISAKKVELLRFSSALNCIVVGGFSKLMKFLLREVAPDLNQQPIVSYADRRWSWNVNCGYINAGFVFTRTTEPSYWYVKSGKTYHRTLFMKHLLQKKLTIFNPNFTEYENMILNGYDRVWDCGELAYVYESK